MAQVPPVYEDAQSFTRIRGDSAFLVTGTEMSLKHLSPAEGIYYRVAGWLLAAVGRVVREPTQRPGSRNQDASADPDSPLPSASPGPPGLPLTSAPACASWFV